MSVIQSCYDTKDILDFFKPQGLYLKPISRLNVSVQLPQLKKSGAKISNWEVMEKVKDMAKPFVFSVFKVSKSSLEFIRFEAEIDNFGSMDQVLKNLDMKTIKLSGFTELLKVRAAEAKTPFPSRSDWDSFFRDSKHMNEMKAGERPDTLHIQNLPTKWFINPHDRSGMSRDKPSEYVLKKVFAAFGEVRAVDIPLLDPYREKMKGSISGIKTFTFGQDLVFDAFIQYKEYIGFVKAMNSLKGMKLLYKDRNEEMKSWVSNIKVDFDKSKHLAESTIKKRLQEREMLITKEREKEDAERREKELEELKRAQELRRMEDSRKERESQESVQRQKKLRRQMEREERRRRFKILGKAKSEDEKIAEEERKLLIAQRKLESIRLLDELLERTVKCQKDSAVKSLEIDLLQTARKSRDEKRKSSLLPESTLKERDEKVLRDKLVGRLKKKEEDKLKELAAKDDTEEDEEEELRLTSSTEDEDPEVRKKRKKDKKEKKKRRKEKKKRKKKGDEEETRKRLELDSHISLAKRIADREKRSRSREKNKKEVNSRFEAQRDAYPDYRVMDRISEAENRRLALKNQKREEEKAKEELYDKMMNPHLYGGDVPTKSGGSNRKLRRGEHYEEIQKEHLENEIRIRERRERMKQRMNAEANRRRWREDEDRGLKRRNNQYRHRDDQHHETRTSSFRDHHRKSGRINGRGESSNHRD